jgi:hypothetical protein
VTFKLLELESAYDGIVNNDFVDTRGQRYGDAVALLGGSDGALTAIVVEYFTGRFFFDELMVLAKSLAGGGQLHRPVPRGSKALILSRPVWGARAPKRSEVREALEKIVAARRADCRSGRVLVNDLAVQRCINSRRQLEPTAGALLAPRLKRGLVNWRGLEFLPPLDYWPAAAIESELGEDGQPVVQSAGVGAAVGTLIGGPIGTLIGAGIGAARDAFGGDSKTDDDDKEAGSEDNDGEEGEGSFFDFLGGGNKDEKRDTGGGGGFELGDVFGDDDDDEEECGLACQVGRGVAGAVLGPVVVGTVGIGAAALLVYGLGKIFLQDTAPVLIPEVSRSGRAVFEGTSMLGGKLLDKVPVERLLGR